MKQAQIVLNAVENGFTLQVTGTTNEGRGINRQLVAISDEDAKKKLHAAIDDLFKPEAPKKSS
jgi:uncharacterized UPF0146 family protein